VKQDVAASKAEQCKKLREAYDKAVQSRRIYKEGKNGEREYVTDQEADAYRARLLNDRKQACVQPGTDPLQRRSGVGGFSSRTTDNQVAG